MTSTRRRIKQSTSLQNRLASFAQEARDKASSLPPGEEKQQWLSKAQRADAACHFDELVRSQGRTRK